VAAQTGADAQSEASRTRTPAASAVVTDGRGRILLVLRANEPQAGRWAVPGGRVELGETLREAAAREVHEETGITVQVGRELGILHVPFPPHAAYEIHDFAATLVAGEATAGDDAADVCWAGAGELAALPLTRGLLERLAGYGLLP